MTSPYHILIVCSVLIIISYLFNAIAGKLRIPAVLLLISMGMGLRYFGDQFNYALPDMSLILELLGITGLIFIVLEGSLDLKLTRDKIPLIRRSFLSALLILLATSAGITAILYYLLHLDYKTSLVYAVPLGVISSAIAIPSVHALTKQKKEFIVYESSFSDILGIMLFNYVVLDSLLSWESVGTFFGGFVAIVVIAIISSFLMAFILDRSKSHAKFYLIFGFMILVYSVAKMAHLPSLLLVMVFGLVLNNPELFLRGKLANWIKPSEMNKTANELRLITAETAFLIRTFFFLLFGYSFDLVLLNDTEVWIVGGLVVALILLVRIIFLRFIAKTHVFPEVFIAPRGLITVILFYSIPAALKTPLFSEGILLVVILSSAILMMIGLMASGRKYDHTLEDI